MKLLDTPAQLKALTTEQAQQYCQTIRSFLVQSVSRTGGHLASNLGIVEISVALARVMDLPLEQVVYDTGHQSYVHKILTGRADRFDTLRSFGGLSGFPRREESEYDPFGTGHSGTGISAALGLARAKKLRGEDGFCVAVIGDGAFTGGMVFEALNNIAPTEKLIIILNDNGMSISKSVGRVKSQLNRMRTAGYYRLKGEVRGTLSHLPLVGEPIARVARQVKNSVKRSALPMGNLFEQFGLHYFGPADGNDLETVEFLLREAKKRNRPSILHLCTEKGRGFEPARKDPSRFHGIAAQEGKKESGPGASSVFGECLTKLAEEDPRIVAITAAMTDGVGLTSFARRYPDRFFDVGIAEEHAMTFASALAAGGMKPCFAVYATFYQRAVDQLLHDAALQNLPIVLALDRAGLVGEDGATHHGVFDLPLTLPIPGVKIYAPACKEEMMRHLRRGFSETACPSVIRYAKGAFSEAIPCAFPCEQDVEWIDLGEGVPEACVVSFGRQTVSVLESAKTSGASVRVIRFAVLKGFDMDLLQTAFAGMQRVLFVEESVEIGGFSQYLWNLLSQNRNHSILFTKILAIGDAFVGHGKNACLLEDLNLQKDAIRKEIESLVKT